LAGNLKHQIITTAFSTAFRLVSDKNPITSEYRTGVIVQLFSKLNELLVSGDKAKAIDHNLANTITLLFFEND
jgi:hypothetical protein